MYEFRTQNISLQVFASSYFRKGLRPVFSSGIKTIICVSLTPFKQPWCDQEVTSSWSSLNFIKPVLISEWVAFPKPLQNLENGSWGGIFRGYKQQAVGKTSTRRFSHQILYNIWGETTGSCSASVWGSVPVNTSTVSGGNAVLYLAPPRTEPLRSVLLPLDALGRGLWTWKLHHPKNAQKTIFHFFKLNFSSNFIFTLNMSLWYFDKVYVPHTWKEKCIWYI